MKKYLLILCGFVYVCINAQCPSGNLSFSTQTEVNNFLIEYPNCIEFQHSITLSGNFSDPITDLSPFGNLNQIGALTLLQANIPTLEGLENLETIDGNLIIEANNVLSTLNGLQGLTYVGGNVDINHITYLNSLSGLGNLESINGYLSISYVPNLTSLVGQLINLSNINGLRISNTNLVSLNGLPSLNSLPGFLTLWSNDSLTDIQVLSSLTDVGSLTIIDNSNLLNINAISDLNSLNNLTVRNSNQFTTINFLNITELNSLELENLPNFNSLQGFSNLQSINNLSLISLPNISSFDEMTSLNEIGESLEIENMDGMLSLADFENVNISGLEHLKITNNVDLSYCHTPNICSYLSDFTNPRVIENNVSNCLNAPAVYAACGIEMSTQNQIEEETLIYTQNNSIFIKSPIEIKNLAIYDLSGKMILQKNEMNTKEWEQTLFSKGTYIVKIVQTNGKTITQKVLL